MTAADGLHGAAQARRSRSEDDRADRVPEIEYDREYDHEDDGETPEPPSGTMALLRTSQDSPAEAAACTRNG